MILLDVLIFLVIMWSAHVKALKKLEDSDE